MAYPITAFILATGTALGMGGSIFISISRGKGASEDQRVYLGITLALLLVAGIVEMLLMYAVFPTVLRFFGAYGELFTLGEEYIRWIIFGTLFQIIGSGLVPVVRNYDVLRFLFRYVYSEFHELLNRSTWYGTSWKRNDTCGVF